MFNIFKFKNKKLIQVKINNIKRIKNFKKYIWIDIIQPNKKEQKYIKNIFGQKIIFQKNFLNIETSARVFKSNKCLYIRSFFLQKKRKKYSEIFTIIFIIKNNTIFSFREKEISIFRLFILKSKKKFFKKNPYEVLLNILEIKVEQLANEIEINYNYLEYLAKKILNNKDKKFNKFIFKLSTEEDCISKIRICLLDTQRTIKLLIRKKFFNSKQKKITKIIIRDIESLLPHNESLFQKVNFLIQSVMEFLNIEQNKITKILTIISIIFLPPTLIASIYGMNFQYIPELQWHYGYTITIFNMLILSFLPYIYFKFKKWM